MAETLLVRATLYGTGTIVEEACRGALFIDPADHFWRPMTAVEKIAAEAVLTPLAATMTPGRPMGAS